MALGESFLELDVVGPLNSGKAKSRFSIESRRLLLGVVLQDLARWPAGPRRVPTLRMGPRRQKNPGNLLEG